MFEKQNPEAKSHNIRILLGVIPFCTTHSLYTFEIIPEVFVIQIIGKIFETLEQVE